MSKRIIITQKQLNEIVGGNPSYLDGLNSDFKEDGVNQVYTGDKFEDRDSKPVTGSRISKQMRRDAGFYGLNRTSDYKYCTYRESKEQDNNNLNEDNQNLTNNTYGDDKNRVSNTNASTLKWRYGAAKKKHRVMTQQ